MTCKDCIHFEVCYKKNDYDNFPDRCGDFISDEIVYIRRQNETGTIWGTRKLYRKEQTKMKLIIDISNEQYNKIKEWEDNVTDYQTTLALYRAVRDGKPYEEDSTNV